MVAMIVANIFEKIIKPLLEIHAPVWKLLAITQLNRHARVMDIKFYNINKKNVRVVEYNRAFLVIAW